MVWLHFPELDNIIDGIAGRASAVQIGSAIGESGVGVFEKINNWT